MIPFVDCQGLAGAWSLGTVQTGKFTLQHRVSLPGGFGDEVIDFNRFLIGYAWQQETGDPDTSWTSQAGVGFLCGTPPCSGFSLMNVSKGALARGPNSGINSCMRELIRYAARCTGTDGKSGPEVVAFESVQGAYTQGRGLMQDLRAELEERTGQVYILHHVLMSGSTVGAAQMRHRYYPVFARVPFGVDKPHARAVVTYGDAIGDLQGLDMTWDPQHYKLAPDNSFALSLRPDGPPDWRGLVDAHVTVDHGRLASLIEPLCEAGWAPGESMPEAMIRTGYHPPSLAKSRYDDGEYKGWSWPRRVHADRPGYVLTGGGLHGFVHWSEPRLLTVRECSRLMSYPDVWEWPTTSPNKASAWIGKCCPVTSGRWISNWVARAIEGAPGKRGELIGTYEHYYNFTGLYKDWPGGAVSRRPRSVESA